jgi:hypothetical protein
MVSLIYRRLVDAKLVDPQVASIGFLYTKGVKKVEQVPPNNEGLVFDVYGLQVVRAAPRVRKSDVCWCGFEVERFDVAMTIISLRNFDGGQWGPMQFDKPYLLLGSVEWCILVRIPVHRQRLSVDPRKGRRAARLSECPDGVRFVKTDNGSSNDCKLWENVNN